MEYIFNITNVEDSTLIPQISKAFEKRMKFYQERNTLNYGNMPIGTNIIKY